MIQANELRIGNLIEFQNEISEVYAISKKGVKIGSGNEMEFKYINPIQLTSQIVEKLGFEMPEQKLSFGNYELMIKTCEGNVNAWLNYKRLDEFVNKHYGLWLEFHCQYLHNLQNLFFALSGEELQIQDLTLLSA